MLDGDDAKVMQRLALLHAKRIALDIAIGNTVQVARRKGISWRLIGLMLEVTGAGARQKYQERRPPALTGTTALF